MKLTCVECPMGCEIEVTLDGEKVVAVKGNTCPRGKAYAENVVTCPRRVLTTSVRAVDGRMVSVKTASPIKKSETFTVMEKINKIIVSAPVKIGQIICENVSENVNLVATSVLNG